MSFDLYLWYEPEPISADQARAKVGRWSEGEPGVFPAHPAVPMVHAALVATFPPLESLSDDDIDSMGAWSCTPTRSDSILALSCVWSWADEVAGVAMKLAGEHGLVCYEPGHHVLNPNAAGYVPPFTLSAAGLPVIPNPDDEKLEWTIGKLDADNYFAVLERADGWYAQVGYGRAAGTIAGTYALEYREGSPDRHFRADTTNRAEVIRFLQDFRAGHGWRRGHRWRRVDF